MVKDETVLKAVRESAGGRTGECQGPGVTPGSQEGARGQGR
jgi:hypothetical protein